MSIKERTLYLILFIISSSSMQAQIDSTYIKKLTLPFSAKIFMTQKVSFFSVENRSNDTPNEHIQTNTPTGIGVGISLRDYSFSFSKGFDFMLDNSRGKTKSIDFEYHGYKSAYIYDIFLQYQKGFYKTVETGSNDVVSIHPDVSMYLYGGNFYYVFNKKHFSYRAIFNQSELQAKSSGSLIAGLSGYYSIVNSDSTLISEYISAKHKNLQFGLSLGYAYTWVINSKWQISGSASIGVNIGNNYPSSFFKHRIEAYPTINSRVGAIYNRKSYAISLTALVNTHYLYYQKDESFSVSNVQIRLAYTRRFNWKNPFVNKTIDKLNNTKSKFRL